jgi:hypothetical protein
LFELPRHIALGIDSSRTVICPISPRTWCAIADRLFVRVSSFSSIPKYLQTPQISSSNPMPALLQTHPRPILTACLLQRALDKLAAAQKALASGKPCLVQIGFFQLPPPAGRVNAGRGMWALKNKCISLREWREKQKICANLK